MDIVNLKQISTINMGQSPKSESYNYENDGLPFFQGKTDFGDVYPTIRMYCNDPIKIAEKNDILISVRAPVGDVNISNFNCCIGRGLAGISPNSEVLYYKYLFYVLKYKKNEISNKGTGSTFKAINKGIIENIEIPLPDLQIQHKIADALDKAQFLIDKRKEQIKECDRLIESLFYDMFLKNDSNWSNVSLKDICLGKGEYGSGASATQYIEGMPRYIRITDIKDDGRLNEQKVSPSNEKNFSKYVLEEGDILFARTGATVGKTYKYSSKDGYCIFAGYLVRFKPDTTKINPEYVFRFTKTNRYKKWIELKQKIVAQPNINAKQYGEELMLPLPPLELQNEFAEKVQKIEEQKQLLEKSLSLMEENFNSLIQKAFRGELF